MKFTQSQRVNRLETIKNMSDIFYTELSFSNTIDDIVIFGKDYSN